MPKAILFLLFVLLSQWTMAQADQNFSIAKENTTCDSLQNAFQSVEDAYQKIEATTFSYQQSFKLSQVQGLKSAGFYSCDTQNGFLLLQYHDRKLVLKGVPKTTWNDIILSNDPESACKKVAGEYTKIPE